MGRAGEKQTFAGLMRKIFVCRSLGRFIEIRHSERFFDGICATFDSQAENSSDPAASRKGLALNNFWSSGWNSESGGFSFVHSNAMHKKNKPIIANPRAGVPDSTLCNFNYKTVCDLWLKFWQGKSSFHVDFDSLLTSLFLAHLDFIWFFRTSLG